MSYLSNVANFNLPHLYLVPPLQVTPFEFCGNLWLLCSVACVILDSAILIQYQHVTREQTDQWMDGQMMMANTVLA